MNSVSRCFQRQDRSRNGRWTGLLVALAVVGAGPIRAQDTPLVLVDPQAVVGTARIVAGPEGRALLAQGDLAYAQGSAQTPLTTASEAPRQFRVLRRADMDLHNPAAGTPFGEEVRLVGTARLRRAESAPPTDIEGRAQGQARPAVIEIVTAREEVRVGDLLVPLP